MPYQVQNLDRYWCVTTSEKQAEAFDLLQKSFKASMERARQNMRDALGISSYDGYSQEQK